MNIGAITVFVAFGSAGAALAAYAIDAAGNAAARRAGRALFALMTLALAVASVLMMAAILGDDFSIPYVQNYSSRDLPLLYKVSAFWGGQEGTILLWALLQAVIGLLVLRRRDEWEPSVMAFLLVPQTLLLLILVRMKPFQTFPPPPDGNGLNPLLQDPWMAIHPPIVFLGYAALVVPFAFALAAAARNRSDAWVSRVLPWTLLSVLTLGLGLFLGGFWAYKVLGWGGYWGWDPVENSSLAPWLVGCALIHSLLTQRATGALKRTNLVLGALAYILVIYSTYMTRSGVLANFSVHSFGEGETNALLLLFMATCTLLPALLIGWRWARTRGPALRFDLSLSPMMAVGVVLLILATALLVVGTSWPILSGLFGEPASPGPGFYNRTSLPIGIGIAAILVVAPLMGWLPLPGKGLFRQAAPGLAAGLLASAVPLAFGLWPKGGLLTLLLLAASVGALYASAVRVARQGRVSLWMIGAGVAHAGLAMMFIGIVTTSAYDKTDSVVLPAGSTVDALGHKLTYRQYVFRPEESEPHFEIEVQPAGGGGPFVATPIMFRDTRREQVIARPYISRSLLGDLYIAPVSHRPAEGPTGALVLQKEKPVEWGGYRLTFHRFQSHASDENTMNVGAAVTVEKEGRSSDVTLSLIMGPEGVVSPEVPLFEGTAVTGRLDGMQVEAGTVRVTLHDPSAATTAEAVAVDVSSKPLVNILWLGILLVAGGSGLAGWQRVREQRLAAAEAARAKGGKAAAAPKMVALGRRNAEG